MIERDTKRKILKGGNVKKVFLSIFILPAVVFAQNTTAQPSVPAVVIENPIQSVKFDESWFGSTWQLEVTTLIDGQAVSFTAVNKHFKKIESSSGGINLKITTYDILPVSDASDKHELTGTIVAQETSGIGTRFDCVLEINGISAGLYSFGLISWQASGGAAAGSVNKNYQWSWPHQPVAKPSYAYGYTSSKPASVVVTKEPTEESDCDCYIPKLWQPTGLTQKQVDDMAKPYNDCMNKVRALKAGN